MDREARAEFQLRRDFQDSDRSGPGRMRTCDTHGPGNRRAVKVDAQTPVAQGIGATICGGVASLSCS